MVNTEISTLKVSGVHPTITNLFVLMSVGVIAPQPGISLCKFGTQYTITKRLEMGGKRVIVLEIVDGILQPAGN